MFVRSQTRTAEVVHETCLALIVLERHDVAVEVGLLDSARQELLGGTPGDSFRSGFLLGVQADAATHPACLELAARLREQMLGDVEAEFALSFCKLGEGTPPRADEGPFFEGVHLDTHPELTGSVELLRLLVNLSEHPRRFQYALTDRWTLAEQGIRYGRCEFERLELPPRTATREVVIPGRTGSGVHALKFLASAVPHVGLNEPPEHFLVSFEALVEVDDRMNPKGVRQS